ncbi:MAG: hypothetical protein LCH41_06265 [Armatimonadetes bacterium]|nr:hypothetical protein [Armatimonadota bacterium]
MSKQLCLRRVDASEMESLTELPRWNDEWEALARRCARAWARRVGLGREDSEDAEQEVVVHTYIRVQEGKLSGPEGVWILARNRVLDMRSQIQKVAWVPFEDEHGSSSVTSDLNLMIEEVREKFPELVVLAEARAAGFEWEMIAEAFGVPTGTLRVQWSRMARKASSELGKTWQNLLHVESARRQ